MAELDSLIRVRTHAIEQKQKFLAELYRKAEELKQQRLDFIAQMQKEKENIQDMGMEMFVYYENYVKSAKERIAEIEVSEKQLDVRIVAAQDDMRDAFAELKKIEIIQEQRIAEEKAAQNKKESDLMDEIGIDGFRRLSEDD